MNKLYNNETEKRLLKISGLKNVEKINEIKKRLIAIHFCIK